MRVLKQQKPITSCWCVLGLDVWFIFYKSVLKELEWRWYCSTSVKRWISVEGLLKNRELLTSSNMARHQTELRLRTSWPSLARMNEWSCWETASTHPKPVIQAWFSHLHIAFHFSFFDFANYLSYWLSYFFNSAHFIHFFLVSIWIGMFFVFCLFFLVSLHFVWVSVMMYKDQLNYFFIL